MLNTDIQVIKNVKGIDKNVKDYSEYTPYAYSKEHTEALLLIERLRNEVTLLNKAIQRKNYNNRLLRERLDKQRKSK